MATRKREIAGITREEHEEELDSAAYDRILLADADPARRAIRKVRHVFPFAGHVLELDVFVDAARPRPARGGAGGRVGRAAHSRP